MTYQVVKMQADHLRRISEAEPGDMPDGFTADDCADYLAEQPNSWTLLDGDEVLWVGGTIEQWPGRHIGWSYTSQDAGPAMRRITREAIKVLEAAGPVRVDMTVRADFTQGHRWAKLLGFEIEAPLMRRYGPAGEDHVGYVRLNS